MTSNDELEQMAKFDAWFNAEWRECIYDRPRVQRIALRTIAWSAWLARSKQEQSDGETDLSHQR